MYPQTRLKIGQRERKYSHMMIKTSMIKTFAEKIIKYFKVFLSMGLTTAFFPFDTIHTQ